jgi:hypothetical protein
MATAVAHATIEELLEAVSSVWFRAENITRNRCNYKRVSLEIVQWRSVGGWCEMAASLGFRTVGVFYKIGKITTSFRNHVSTCITSRLTHYMFQLTSEPSSGELQNNNTKRKLQRIRCYIDRLTISAIT